MVLTDAQVDPVGGLLLDGLPPDDNGTGSDNNNDANDNDAVGSNDDDGDHERLCLLPDLPARNKALFCDAPNSTRQAAWAAVGIAQAYDGMAIEV